MRAIHRLLRDVRRPKVLDFHVDVDEPVLLEGAASRPATMFGGKWGRLVLTRRKLLWHESKVSAWPHRPMTIEIPLTDVENADKGDFLERVLHAAVLRITLKSGRIERFVVKTSREQTEWIKTLGAST